MIIEHGTWIVAADGGGAVVYRNIGNGGAAKLELVETLDHKHASFTRDIGTDRPGRTHTAAGGRTSVSGPDYHDQAEQEFAKRLALHLDELLGPHAHGAAQQKLVLFASPRFLGMIRPAYSPRLRATLKAEVAKDLREAPAGRIEQALTELDHV
jgi:protein required for attachment to host cells